MQAKVSSVMDFLEKPEKLSGTDKAEKVIRKQGFDFIPTIS